MKVKLAWGDSNYGVQGFNVYRDTQPIDENDLPAPLSSLGPGDREYEDDSVIDGKTYYYRVSALVDGVEKLTEEKEVQAGGTDPEPLVAPEIIDVIPVED